MKGKEKKKSCENGENEDKNEGQRKEIKEQIE